MYTFNNININIITLIKKKQDNLYIKMIKIIN